MVKEVKMVEKKFKKVRKKEKEYKRSFKNLL